MPQINFKGKEFVKNYHLQVKHCELIPDKSKSLTDKVSLHDNLIIHGDNLKALKALIPTYAGKIKCIYIDPPYNTGNESWAYNDNVSSPMIKDWLGKVVDRDDLTRHDKWLCMMMPRLKLLRELLSDDGAIFISIDDNEQHHLRQLMDEIFGEENFVANIIWQKKYTQSNDAKYFSDTHDFILSYAKNISNFELGSLVRTDEQNARYSNQDGDPRGPWMTQPLHAKSGSDKTYEFKFSNGVVWKPPVGTFPRYSMTTLEKADKDGEIWFGTNGTAVPRLKKYLAEMKEGVIPKTLWLYDEVGSNDDARKTLKEIFDDNPFDSPKPVTLIQRIIQLTCGKDDIILDSFAGSGTTAHAVLDLNKEDGGNRKFILVECEDYADKITAERIRRVIKGYKPSLRGFGVEPKPDAATPKQSDVLVTPSVVEGSALIAALPPIARNDKGNGTGGTFSFFELGKPIEMEEILSGKNLPSYKDLAKYIFYTATGEEFDETKIDEAKNFIGESKDYLVYLFYQPNIEKLKNIALTADRAEEVYRSSKARTTGKRNLVFAPTKYLNSEQLENYNIDFCQLPFEIYQRSGQDA